MLYGSEFNYLMAEKPSGLEKRLNKAKVIYTIRQPTSFSNVKYLRETSVYLYLAS